jgi:hypothetical protein
MYITSLLVSFSIPKKGESGSPLVLIGKKKLFSKEVEIIHAVSGDDAMKLYEQLHGKPFDLFEI